MLHGDVTPRNIGIREIDGVDTVVLIDWELSSIGTPALDLIHYLGNPPLRPATNNTTLLDNYFEQYISHGGSALDAELWKRSIAVSLVHYGVSLFPTFAGGIIRKGNKEAIHIVEDLTERVMRAMIDLGF